ncbi:unnamed protein product [Rotaria sp. Silwood1]|nr:unnamed protein product [Rotaria sp. Silwood1]
MMNRYNAVRQTLAELNLFDTETTDEHSKRNEILSTRVYIIIIIISLSLFALYTSLQSQRNIITISTPTQKQYEELKLKFSNDLQCPCKYISTPYEQFINIIPKYNQICLSDFISQKWIDYLFYENTSYFFQLDFRHDASSRFQILRTLCEQAQKTINDKLGEFYLLQFITNELISTILFDAQIDTFIQLFKGTTLSSFQNFLKLIRQTTIGNGLLSAIETCFVYAIHPTSSSHIFLDNIYYYENSLEEKIFDCYCDKFTACQNPTGIYANIDRYDYPGSDWPDYPVVNANTAKINATFLIHGMVTGCKPLESLLRSTSECLFEQTCLNQIASYINYSSISINSFSVLNQSQLESNITIEILANNLFVEEWIINKSYEKYFNYCQPVFCHYIDNEKYSFVHILAAVISLYGGLRMILRFIIPNIIKFIRKKKRKQHSINADTNTLTSQLYFI